MKFALSNQKLVSKVDALVSQYIRLFPTEYRYVKEQVKAKRAGLLDPKFGSEDTADTIDRVLGETPETLYGALYSGLTPEEFLSFTSKEGQHWFFNKYEEFRIPSHI
jgi:hypothetical protein